MSRFRALIDAFPALGDGRHQLPIRPIPIGLINETWALGDGYVLQRLHPIFAPEVNLDIAALTSVLGPAGVPVPRLVEAADGRPWVELGPGGDGPGEGVWRIMTRLPGRSFDRVPSPGHARAAGALLARFHGALVGSEHRFAFARERVHDTARHIARARDAVERHPGHRLRDAVAELADAFEERFSKEPLLHVLPRRIGHGDPKISNFLFAGGAEPRTTGLVDLDTMGWTTLDAELGDALRSWCNRAAEDSEAPRLAVDIFEAAMAGYLSEARAWLDPAEREATVAGFERICLELAARFAVDALDERYFRWDPEVAPAPGEHNLIRARGQLALAEQVRRSEGTLRAILARL